MPSAWSQAPANSALTATTSRPDPISHRPRQQGNLRIEILSVSPLASCHSLHNSQGRCCVEPEHTDEYTKRKKHTHLHENKKNIHTNASFYHSPSLPKKHNHVEISFNDLTLVYNDPRRFGFFQIVKNKENLTNRFKNYGPEPFDKNFNLDYMVNYFKDKKKDIKSFLLDQKFVSGIGNIYANEILYLSKINPKIPVKKLKKTQFKLLIKNSKKVLLNAIKKGGSTIRDFKNTLGDTGNFQKEFKVYGRQRLNCLRSNCTGVITKIVQSNRSTFLCKLCQK